MPEQTASIPAEPDPMYVGYRPLPRAHRRFIRLFITALLLGALAAGGVVALAHRSPGPGVWDLAAEREWTGIVRTSPYPVLITPAGESWLLVSVTKTGVHDRVASFEGQHCRIRGYALTREHRQMIEISPDETALARAAGESPLPNQPVATREPVELVAEIVDGKCFLGAMKPGDGKGHKACAVLCIRGGLPPLVADASQGQYPLLIVDGSTELSEAVLALVGEPVRIRGVRTTVAGVPVIETSASDIERP